MSWMEKFEDNLRRAREERDAEEAKLEIDPCAIVPEVGDRVLVNAFIVGRGHKTKLLECVVLEAASAGYKLEFVGRKDVMSGGPDTDWVAAKCILDVLGHSGESIGVVE